MSQPLNVYSACLLLHLEEKQGTLVGAKCRRWDFMHLMMMQFQNLKPHHEKHQSYMTPIQQPSLTFLRVQAIGKKGPLFLIFTSCALTPPNQKKEWSRCKWILPDETGTWMSGWRMRALGFAEVVGRWPPCYKQLWINSLFLVLCGWTRWFPQLSWTSQQIQWALPNSADPSLGPRVSWEDRGP